MVRILVASLFLCVFASLTKNLAWWPAIRSFTRRMAAAGVEPATQGL